METALLHQTILMAFQKTAHALLALPDLLDCQVIKERKAIAETRVRRVKQASQAVMVTWVMKEQKANAVILAIKAQLVRRELQAKMESAQQKDRQDQKAKLALQVLKETKACQANVAMMALQEPKEKLVRKEAKANQEKTDQLACLERAAALEPMQIIVHAQSVEAVALKVEMLVHLDQHQQELVQTLETLDLAHQAQAHQAPVQALHQVLVHQAPAETELLLNTTKLQALDQNQLRLHLLDLQAQAHQEALNQALTTAEKLQPEALQANHPEVKLQQEPVQAANQPEATAENLATIKQLHLVDSLPIASSLMLLHSVVATCKWLFNGRIDSLIGMNK